ncbi:MAG: MOSC domain-containing protein [Saprospiraceae bacterium]
MIILPEEKSFLHLFENFVQSGEVIWMGIRPAVKAPMIVLEEVEAVVGGLIGDRSNKGNPESNRQVTLIQYEHLQAVASLLGKEFIDPALTRRNIVVKGINLNALKNKKIVAGEAILEMTGYCHPCSNMEANLGHGGFNAMRGHGGITCKVVKEGKIRLGDQVSILPD